MSSEGKEMPAGGEAGRGEAAWTPEAIPKRRNKVRWGKGAGTVGFEA